MKKLNLMNGIVNVFDELVFNTKKYAPQILAGLGIAGFVSTTVLAVKATPKAYEKLKAAKEEKKEDLTLKEKAQTVWKDYIPAGVTCIASGACIIGSVSTSCRRSAVLATAYKLSEEAAKEYKNKVVEIVGEKKEKEIRESIAQDRINNNPPKSNQIIFTNKGDTLIYETISGRYFKFDIDKIHKIENELNYRMRDENYVSLNELFLELGIEPTEMGFELGWSVGDGPLEFQYDSKLTKDDEPCLVLGYSRSPKAGYSLFYND